MLVLDFDTLAALDWQPVAVRMCCGQLVEIKRAQHKGQLPVAFINDNGHKTVFDVKILEQLLLLVGGETQITLNINDTGPAVAANNIAKALVMPLRVKDTGAVYVWGEEEND